MWSIFFVFLSYLDRNVVKGDFLSRALNAEKKSEEMFSMINGTFCAKMSIIGDHFLYQVSDGAEVVRSVVSPAGKLLNCSVTVNQMQVKSFMHECRLGLKEQGAGWQLETHFTRMDEAKMMCREFKERSTRGRLREDVSDGKVLQRSKRGFTYPGTLWCGAGNMADDYNQLGEFADTDSCCRIHDHCPQVIHAFSSNYGHTNFKWHSICHCDCDNALKDCLRRVNDTSSRVVGQAFFNVISVPCFEIAYEEQCAERHWYGLCKRYEKLPIAVLKEAVPYDFGGIDVIDELPIAPSKTKYSKEGNEEEKPDTSTQSNVLGPEEPSLTNVVTAAEDFIKVLATVSTSQSSTADSDKDETHNSEKKKKKNTGKKKKINKKQKGKRKGRKRKQKSETGVKSEEGAAVSPSGSKADEVLAWSNFISESRRYNQPSMNTNSVDDSQYQLRAKNEASNEVMKDEPANGKETVSFTTPSVQKKPVNPDTAMLKEEITLSTTPDTTVPHSVKTKRQRLDKRKKSKKTHFPSSIDLGENISEHSNVVTSPAVTTQQPEGQSFSELQLFASATSAPIVIPKAQRIRSKCTQEREGRKKRRKVSPAAPTVLADHQNSFVDSQKIIPFTSPPTIKSVPTTELQLSHRPDIYRESIQITALSSTVSVLKRQRLKERRLRNRRRKTASTPSGEKPLFSHSSSKNMPTAPTTPDTYAVLNQLASTAEIKQIHQKLFTTTSTVSEKRHRQPTRKLRKERKKAAALRDTVSIPKHTEPVTLSILPFVIATSEELRSENHLMTTSAPIMTPLQLSIEKAKAQFNRKKRMKGVLIKRHS